MFAADWGLGEVLLAALWIFFLVLWFWLLITILVDLFRDHELSGWWKAAWVIFIIVLPFLGVLIYLIARGQGMAERSMQQAQQQQDQFDTYVRQTAGGASSADELQKLADLKEKGTISDDEYDKMKAKIIGT